MPATSYKNCVLASLPKTELVRLAAQLSPVKLAQGQVLLEAGRTANYAYFLESGLASIVTTMNGGPSVEVGVVGNEGIIGLSILLGTDSMPHRTFMQVPGSGFRLKARFLEEEVDRRGELRQMLQVRPCALSASVPNCSLQSSARDRGAPGALASNVP